MSFSFDAGNRIPELLYSYWSCYVSFLLLQQVVQETAVQRRASYGNDDDDKRDELTRASTAYPPEMTAGLIYWRSALGYTEFSLDQPRMEKSFWGSSSTVEGDLHNEQQQPSLSLFRYVGRILVLLLLLLLQQRDPSGDKNEKQARKERKKKETGMVNLFLSLFFFFFIIVVVVVSLKVPTAALTSSPPRKERHSYHSVWSLLKTKHGHTNHRLSVCLLDKAKRVLWVSAPLPTWLFIIC